VWAADVDWGGKIENISQVSNIENEEFTQGNKAGFWLRSSFSPGLNIFGKAGYIYRFENEEHQHTPDISELYLYGKSNLGDGKALSYKAGRFRFRDSSTYIMKSAADGAEVLFKNNAFPLRAGIGYTGLIFNETSEVVMSMADTLDSDEIFASPRLLGFAELSSVPLAGGNTLKLAVIAQLDLRPEDSGYVTQSQTGKLHTQYVQLSADGPIIPELFYSLSTVLQTGQYLVPAYDPEPSARYSYMGGMAAFSLDYYAEPRYNTTISLEALYSSGDSWSDRSDFNGLNLPGSSSLHRFIPISKSTKGYVYSPELGNLIFGDVSLSVMPVEQVQLLLSAITFLRAVDGPIFDDYISEDSGNSLYLGEEIDFTVNYRPFSDLGFSLSSGIFIPNQDIQSEKDITYRVGGYLSVSF